MSADAFLVGWLIGLATGILVGLLLASRRRRGAPIPRDAWAVVKP